MLISVLLENATHLVQPLDVRIFSPMKAEMMNMVANWRQKNPGKTLTKYELVRVVLPALRTVLGNKDTIKEGFKCTGLYVPGKGWDPSQVDFSRMKASEVFAQKKDVEDRNSVSEQVPEVPANVPEAHIVDEASLRFSPPPSYSNLFSITNECSSGSTEASVNTMSLAAVTPQLGDDLTYLIANDSTLPLTIDPTVPLSVSVSSDPITSDPIVPVTSASDPAFPIISDHIVPVSSDPVAPIIRDPVDHVTSVQDVEEPVESDNATLKFSKKLSLEDRKRR